MSSLRPGELARLVAAFPGSSLLASSDGTAIVAIPRVALPPGWSLTETDLWFAVPVGYPAAPPDCFWAAPELRLATGAAPSNAGAQVVPILQRSGLWFSWHLATWRPSLDDLTTYSRFIVRRFADAR